MMDEVLAAVDDESSEARQLISEPLTEQSTLDPKMIR